MSKSDAAELFEAERDNGFVQKLKMGLSPTSFPELLLDLKNAFSVDKTIRELACDICKIVLARLSERLGNAHIDICAIFGSFEDLDTLKLKGAAGFQPYGMLKWEQIKFGEGIIGKVAQDKRPMITKDLGRDPRAGTKPEQAIAQLAEKVAVLAQPLVLADGELAGVLLIGKFHSGALPGGFLREPGLGETLEWLAMHIATAFHNALWVNKAKLGRKYLENERHIGAITRQFYSDTTLDRNLKKLMETICSECMDILNSGNPQQPFYHNFLFYEYQEYRKRFVLRSYLRKPRSVLSSFHIHSRHYKEYVQDRQVKCLESQSKFVQKRGKYPYVVRFLFEHKIESIKEKLDANWSPAMSGTAFIVPLFEGNRPLGAIVFWSRQQNRQYVNESKFYLGPERRTTGLNDLRFFRSLQPLIASEYYKLKADEERRRRITDLENLMGALKEVILIEEKSEVLDRLAEFTAKSLNAEGCIIHLVDSSKSQLAVQAVAGFSSECDLKKTVSFSLKQEEGEGQPKGLPVQILENQKEIIANSSREFRRRSGSLSRFRPFFQQLKSGRVISYLGRPIGNLGVIEVFNKSQLTPSGWSFFQEQDSVTLRYISEAIATVLNRMEATAFQVKSEKVKATRELLLDISHELKNPLYSSLIFVRKLKESINGRLKSATEQAELQTLGLIERNIEKAQRILGSMQSFQTIMTDMKAERVDLEKIIRVVIETNKSFCEQQGITVQTDFWAPQPLVQGDGLKLNQAFTNLVTNAIEAMPHGGTLTIRLWEVNGAFHIEVQDTGSGIPRAIKDRVFEPFVTTKDSHKGTGLGLALSQRIINQHQGKIDFETQEGCGTKFLVVLPKYVAPIGPASPVTQ